jgi:[protein-PII] uridylyltransferase
VQANPAQRIPVVADTRTPAPAANRREDRLVFDMQNAVAETFGYVNVHPAPGTSKISGARQRGADEALLLGGQGGDAAQPDIDAQHRGAAQPLHACARATINAHVFNNKAGMIDVVSDDLYQREPHAILETFLVYQRTWAPRAFRHAPARALQRTQT